MCDDIVDMVVACCLSLFVMAVLLCVCVLVFVLALVLMLLLLIVFLSLVLLSGVWRCLVLFGVVVGGVSLYLIVNWYAPGSSRMKWFVLLTNVYRPFSFGGERQFRICRGRVSAHGFLNIADNNKLGSVDSNDGRNYPMLNTWVI